MSITYKRALSALYQKHRLTFAKMLSIKNEKMVQPNKLRFLITEAYKFMQLPPIN